MHGAYDTVASQWPSKPIPLQAVRGAGMVKLPLRCFKKVEAVEDEANAIECDRIDKRMKEDASHLMSVLALHLKSWPRPLAILSIQNGISPICLLTKTI